MQRDYELMKMRQNAVVYGMLAVGGVCVSLYVLTGPGELDAAGRAIAGFSALGALFCGVLCVISVRGIRQLSRRG